MAKKMRLPMVLFVSVAFLAGIPTYSWSQSPDNTKVNKRDRSQNEMTADQQGQSKQDREVTQQIRQAIVKDKSLSTDARNVKVITKDGMTTLKGPVKSEEEKQKIEQAAGQIAGKDKIKSQIEVSAKKEQGSKQG